MKRRVIRVVDVFILLCIPIIPGFELSVRLRLPPQEATTRLGSLHHHRSLPHTCALFCCF